MFETSPQVTSAHAGSGDIRFAAAPVPEIDLRKIWFTIWRGKATILLTTVVALALAVAFILIAPHKFTAVTQILIDPTDLRAVGTEAATNNQASDATLLYVESQVSVLSSDSVLRRVVASENLADDREFARTGVTGSASLNELLAALGFPGPTPADKTLTALNQLKRQLRVSRTERTYVIDISVTSISPEKAARIANAIAQAYLAEQTQIRADAARQVSQALSSRLDELKSRVREAEDRAETYKANNNIIGANGQLVDEQQLGELNNQLGAARARTAEAKARLDQIEDLQKTKDVLGAFPEALQSPTITALRTQYAEVMRREAEQTATLGARHPAVIDIQAQADRLRNMIADELNRTTLSARGTYEVAKADENALSKNLDTLKHTAVTTNQAMVGLRELDRDVQASRAVYEAFLVRARETGEQERIDTKNIRIISNAELPQRRSSPPSTLLMALGALLVGAAAGVAIVLLRGPVAAAAAPGGSGLPAHGTVPILAVLPHVEFASGRDAVDDTRSLFATEIRKVYAALQANRKQRRNPSVLVLAAHGEDDAAAVVLTLAAMAASTQRVLVIDADRECRTLAAIDADQGEAGLVDVAIGRRSLADAVVRDRDTNINLLPFVSRRSRRDRPISDEDVKQAFAQTKNFDMVIVTAVDLRRDPTARFFAGLVDHIVLLVKADEADGRAFAGFISRLGLDAKKIRGAVLTGTDAAVAA